MAHAMGALCQWTIQSKEILMRNLILTVFCWFANRRAAAPIVITPQFMVWASMGDDCGGPQEIRGFHTLEEAMANILREESTNHPDIYWWIEEGGTGKVYDSSSDLCGYCGTSQNPNDICKPCFDALQTDVLPEQNISFWHWIFHHTF